MLSASFFDDRRQVLAWVHLVSAASLAFFAFIHWYNDCCYALTLVESVLVLVMLIAYWRIRNGASLTSIENTLMASAVVLFSSLLLFETIDHTGAFWLAGFPFVAYFVQHLNKARFWVCFLTLEIAMAAALQSYALVETPYSTPQLFCLVAIVLFFWLLAHIYQSQLESHKLLLRQSYQKMAEQQERIQVVLDHSPVGIWMVDTHRHIQFLNKAWVQWSGISEAQARHTEDYSTLMPEPLAEKALASDQTCLAGGGAYCFRETILCADGHERTFDMIKVRLAGADGQAVGLVGFSIDVSKQVKAEAEQRLLEQQMQHAQRLESLGVMAGGIAHDFNNLLTAIKGGIELLRLEEDLPAGMQASIQSIDSAAQAAIELCRQMLAYSGKGFLKMEPFYICDMIKEMHSLLEVSINKHVELHYDFGKQEIAINADRSQFRQVLLNLVTNASEAIAADQQGTINISITQRQPEIVKSEHFIGTPPQPGNYAVLSIRDNGTGMDKNTLEHMFDPFFTTKFTGRGLGLSAISGILRAHQAGLEVDSEPGVGTQISVWFPCSDEVVEPSQIKQDTPAQQHVLQGLVLLVDDEEGVLQVASRMLSKLELNVQTASNGKQAVEIFSANPSFDWVLLDVTMPEMDGIECLQQLKKIKPDIYVILSSGYNTDSGLIPAQGYQPDDFLSKPFTFSDLRAAALRACSISKL